MTDLGFCGLLSGFVLDDCGFGGPSDAGAYKVKAGHLVAFYEEAKKNERLFQKVVYKNVPREDCFQSEADRLVNLALDER